MRKTVFLAGRQVLVAVGLMAMSLGACADDDASAAGDDAVTVPTDAAPPPEELEPPAFTSATIGPGRLGTWIGGMTLQETLEASGAASLTLEESPEYNGPPTSLGESTQDMSCFYLYLGDDPEQAHRSGVSGIGGVGRAMAIEVRDPSVRTDAGIGVGSTLAELEVAHPGATPDPMYAQLPDRVLDAPLPDGSTGRIYFSFDEGMRIARMTTGTAEWTSLPEGCMDVSADHWTG